MGPACAVVDARETEMARNDIPEGVTVIETGNGGMSLVQELMAGYDALAMPSKRFTPPAQAIDVYNEEQTANYVNRY